MAVSCVIVDGRSSTVAARRAMVQRTFSDLAERRTPVAGQRQEGYFFFGKMRAYGDTVVVRMVSQEV